uniref:Uncharacterized protein n=1 Tax=Siphoviridae sp. ctiOl67 TaxID=2825622 RepID=A0A8S5QJL6_9CAUD|nr:MAG TPA: hypothetical protein [Siphoviridae sp. ctiOl67]
MIILGHCCMIIISVLIRRIMFIILIMMEMS